MSIERVRSRGLHRSSTHRSKENLRDLLTLGPDDPSNDDAEEVETEHRRRKDDLGHHVASRRDYGCDDKDQKQGVLEISDEEPRGEDLHLCEEEHDGRHLEHDAHADEQLRVQPEHFFQLGHESEIGRVEAGEKHHDERKRDVVVERGAGQEHYGGEEYERNREPLLVGVQTGRDKPPDLIHDERSREHHAYDERNLDVERKGFAGLRVDQLDAGRQRPPRRREDEVENPVDESEAKQNADGYRDARIDDALPELIEMLEKRHLRA